MFTPHRHTLIRAVPMEKSSPFYSSRPFPGLPTSRFDPPPALSVSEIEVTHSELAELFAQPGVVAVPPVFPTALVAPVETAAVAAAAASWGIATVGAGVSAFDGAGSRVAVLDTGIDAAHPAFAGVKLAEHDFTGTGNGDGRGHGTHCAGTIFGRDIDGTRIGVARGVTDAMIGKVLDADGAGNSRMLFEALAWAINGNAHLISMSLGFDFPGYVDDLVTRRDYPVALATSIALRNYSANLRALDALMAFAKAQAGFGFGPLVLAASGNESKHPAYGVSASVPAAADGVVSVGALRSSGNGLELASFSNTDCLLVAPGVGIVSARPGGGLVARSGTSMACTHAVGIAALWRQALVAQGSPAGPSQLSAKLLATAVSGSIVDYVPILHGSGLVQAP